MQISKNLFELDSRYENKSSKRKASQRTTNLWHMADSRRSIRHQSHFATWLGLGDPVRYLPREFLATDVPNGLSDILVFCGGCLVVGAAAYADDVDAPNRIAKHPAFSEWPLIVVTDEPARAAKSPMNFLWTTFTRFVAAADVYAAST